VRFRLRSRDERPALFQAIAEQSERYDCIRVLRPPSAVDGGLWELAGLSEEDALHLAGWLEALPIVDSVRYDGALKTVVLVSDVPADLAQLSILSALSAYGSIISCEHVMELGVRMSSRLVSMRVRTRIPGRIVIEGSPVTITYTQQPPTCATCGGFHPT